MNREEIGLRRALRLGSNPTGTRPTVGGVAVQTRASRWSLVALLALVGCVSGSLQSGTGTKTVDFMPKIAGEIALRSAEVDQIDEPRRESLVTLAKSIDAALESRGIADLTFICTHNSRRSHLSMIWAKVAAEHFGVENVRTFSGGTEATAFNPRAVASLERHGFEIDRMDESTNPVYAVHYAKNGETLHCSSKVFDQAPNPTSNFIAVMTCSSADRECPYVPGASERVAVPYEDPKAYDGTDREAATYDERQEQIARELLYVFAQVAEMRDGRSTNGRSTNGRSTNGRPPHG